MKRAVTAAVTAAAATALLIAGCSSNDEGGKGTTGGDSNADATKAALQVAQKYQSAVNDEDWPTACRLRTERYRHGSVKECVANNQPKTESPEPTPSESEFPPLRRADGSIVPGKSTPSASGPDRAETGEVKASAPQDVPAIGDHPAGTGVRVEYTVTWPDSTTTSRKALRVVRQGDRWLVDQSEDIAESDEAHGDPVRDALTRG
ncbi:hypothetical protein [Streptomyces sp. NPDC058625]|uniref:hypothetical protein n=1 Tax=Streptomyces sp. NPDC058625 TaxID=3346564 RepID=UPI0036505C7F